MLLSFYTACTLFPLLCLLGLMFRLMWKRRPDALLCTECQSCITRCPATGRDCGADGSGNAGGNAYDIIRWAKTGSTHDPQDPTLQALQASCRHCGLCRKDCPRGLSPHTMLKTH